MVYGYIRVSTKHQSLERQRKNIKDVYPSAIIYEEIFTGTKIDGRVKFNKLLKILKAGDTVVFDSVSRMSRNASEGIDLYFELISRGINLEFIKEPYINTTVYTEKLVTRDNIVVDDPVLNNTIIQGIREYLDELARNQIKIVFDQVEKEVLDTRQRVREGIYQAKLMGVQIGGKQGSKRVTEKEKKAKRLMRKYLSILGGELNDIETMSLINGREKGFSISRKTFYKYKQELIYEKISKEFDINDISI